MLFRWVQYSQQLCQFEVFKLAIDKFLSCNVFFLLFFFHRPLKNALQHRWALPISHTDDYALERIQGSVSCSKTEFLGQGPSDQKILPLLLSHSRSLSPSYDWSWAEWYLCQIKAKQQWQLLQPWVSSWLQTPELNLHLNRWKPLFSCGK